MMPKLKNLFGKKKPVRNVILVALDGVRLDFMQEFPEFRKLIQRGTLFSNVTAYSPHSIASFHAIFTGVYGCHNGVNSFFGTPKFKTEKCKTLTEYMKEQGYYCFGDSMNDLVIPKKGFDSLVEQEAFKEFIDQHKEIVHKIKKRNDAGEPCFVHFHCSYAHNDVVEEFIKKFKNNEEEFYKNKTRNIETYKKSLQKVETYVNMMVSFFEEHDLFKNSLLVFFSDHGTSIGEKKGERAYGTFCYDYSLKTFCLFVGEKIFPQKEVTHMVRNIDIMPTILEVMDLKEDRKYMKIDGQSLMEYTRADEPQKRIAFAETGGMDGPWPSPKEPNIHVIRTDEWKLIYNRTPKTYELYNLKKDPQETTNCMTREKKKADELKLLLRQYPPFNEK